MSAPDPSWKAAVVLWLPAGDEASTQAWHSSIFLADDFSRDVQATECYELGFAPLEDWRRMKWYHKDCSFHGWRLTSKLTSVHRTEADGEDRPGPVTS